MHPSEKSLAESDYLELLGQRVRQARAEAALTRRQLADRSGLSERYLAQLEAGQGNISILLIRRVAAALSTTLASLLAESPDRSDRARRIALIGLRGAGKSTIGSLLAQQLGCQFVELDQAVERELGTALESIFTLYGQDAYRDAERRALERVIAGDEHCVIATGGSIVVEQPTYELLRKRCLTVWLRALPEDHMNRVIAQGDLRPIRGRDFAMAELKTILDQRQRLYAMADLTVETSGREVEPCVAQLVALLKPSS
jgi:XRE family transcriptional regulator, aerobic/anaerobic benzoate catabolism transcriptional regulator